MIEPNEKATFENPSLIVGISAYNEERNILKLLTRLANEQLGEYWLKKIIVVSSGSTDKTDELVEGFRRKNPVVQLITEPQRRGKYAAVNRILNAGKEAEVTILVSADTVPSRWALHYVSMYFKKVKGLGGLCSRIIPVNEGSKLGDRLGREIWNFHDVFLMLQSEQNQVTHLGGEFTAIRSNKIESIPPVIQDELYLGMRLVRMGYSVVYAPEIVVNIRAPSNIYDFMRQRLRTYVGHRELAEMYGDTGTNINKIISDPEFAFGLVKPIIMSNGKNLHVLLAFVILEVSLWFKARSKRFEEYTAWKMVSSTKELGGKQDDHGKRPKE
jgi:biofilm PGA synthesis N-glycosyltransferase PgaC